MNTVFYNTPLCCRHFTILHIPPFVDNRGRRNIFPTIWICFLAEYRNIFIGEEAVCSPRTGPFSHPNLRLLATFLSPLLDTCQRGKGQRLFELFFRIFSFLAKISEFSKLCSLRKGRDVTFVKSFCKTKTSVSTKRFLFCFNFAKETFLL